MKRRGKTENRLESTNKGGKKGKNATNKNQNKGIVSKGFREEKDKGVEITKTEEWRGKIDNRLENTKKDNG